MIRGAAFVARTTLGGEVWDSFVHGCDEAWLWHTYAFQDTLCTWPGRRDDSQALVNERGEILAVLPLHRIERRVGGVRVANMLDSFGGPACHSGLPPRQRRDVYDGFATALRELAKSIRAVDVRVSLPPMAPAWRGDRCPRVNPLLELGGDNTLTQTWVLDLRKTREELWNDLEGRTRTAIRKAQKAGVQIRWESHPGDLERYYKLHLETYRRTGARPHPRGYFSAIWENFVVSGLALVGFAEHEGQTVAAESFALYKGAALYWTGASDARGMELGANSLLQWEAIERFHSGALTHYEVGEAFPGTQSKKLKGLHEFKKGLGGTLYPYYKCRFRCGTLGARALRAMRAWM